MPLLYDAGKLEGEGNQVEINLKLSTHGKFRWKTFHSTGEFS
jgi:hypothetical protein